MLETLQRGLHKGQWIFQQTFQPWQNDHIKFVFMPVLYNTWKTVQWFYATQVNSAPL